MTCARTTSIVPAASWMCTTTPQVPRNYDPELHQFQAAHEYTRALGAAKLDRVFAKPFLVRRRRTWVTVTNFLSSI